MLRFFYIAFGGILGALLRYSLSIFIERAWSADFPFSTLSVNLIGSFLIGLLYGTLESFSISHNMQLLLFVGVLGSFTTYSTFALDNFHILRSGDYTGLFFNILLSVVLGIGLVFLGIVSSKPLIALFK